MQEAGKASETLHLDQGHVVNPYDDHHHRCREGPARPCRRLRRASARETAAEAVKASETIDPESEVVAVDKSADALEAFVDKNKAVDTEKLDELCDEFCPNEEYLVEDLTDENSETFRFVIKDDPLSGNVEPFINKVKKDFKIKTRYALLKCSAQSRLNLQNKFLTFFQGGGG